MSIIEQKMHGYRLTKRIPKPPTVYADATNQARILFSHPHDYRTWTVIEESDQPEYWILESVIPLGFNANEERMMYTRFEICVHESTFERL